MGGIDALTGGIGGGLAKVAMGGLGAPSAGSAPSGSNDMLGFN